MSQQQQLSTRGALLREISRLSTEILTSDTRLKTATEALARETSTKSSLQQSIAQAEAELAQVERDKAAESANDGELVALQRAVSGMTLRRQELIKQTKAARADRDKARDDVVSSYYARLGAEVEVAAVGGGGGGKGSGSLGSLPVWSAEALKMLGDADALWKRTSNQGVVTRELVEAALFFSDLQWKGSGEGGGGGSSSSSSSSPRKAGETPGDAAGNSSAYTHVGASAVLSDARKSLEAVRDILDASSSLRGRATTEAAAAGAGGEEDDEGGEGGAGAGDASRFETPFTLVESLSALVAQNATMQRSLLVAVEKAMAAKVEPDAAGGKGGGEGEEVGEAHVEGGDDDGFGGEARAQRAGSDSSGSFT